MVVEGRASGREAAREGEGGGCRRAAEEGRSDGGEREGDGIWERKEKQRKRKTEVVVIPVESMIR